MMLTKHLYRSCLVGLTWLVATLISLNAVAGLTIQSWQTQSGSKVLFVENDQLPMLDIEVNFDAGSARDGDVWGLASMTATLLGTATSELNEDQINALFDDVGAQIGSDVGNDSAAFSLRTLTRQSILDKTLPAFAKLLVDAKFEQGILDREMKRLKLGLKQKKVRPQSIASEQLWAHLYGDHPYAHPTSGTLDTVEYIDLANIQAFYKQHYTAGNAVIAMVGNINRVRAEQIAEALTQGLPKANPLTAIPKPISQPAREITVDFDSTQTHYSLSQLGIQRGHPDYVPLYVGNHLFGGSGFSSQLMKEVREARGLVYSVYSYFAPMKQTGIFTIGLSTKNASAYEADEVVKETLKAFLNDFSEEEFDAIKENLLGGWPLRIDSNAKILGYLSVMGYFDLPLNYLEWFPEQVKKTTKQDVLNAWQKHIQPENMLRVMVGKPEEQK